MTLVCPNGHNIAEPLALGCPTCDARILVTPAAVGFVLREIVDIVNEPLNERPGHGPTRSTQFNRIDAVVREWLRNGA